VTTVQEFDKQESSIFTETCMFTSLSPFAGSMLQFFIFSGAVADCGFDQMISLTMRAICLSDMKLNYIAA
jgi:hypothetical protein